MTWGASMFKEIGSKYIALSAHSDKTGGAKGNTQRCVITSLRKFLFLVKLLVGSVISRIVVSAEGNPTMDWHPIQGGVEILLVASCHSRKPELNAGLLAPLGPNADFNFTVILLC